MTDRERDIRATPPPVNKPATSDVRVAARELLGQYWTEPLSIMLGVNVRTVQRWAAGQNAVPESVAARVSEMLTVAQRFRRASSSATEQSLYRLSDAAHELLGERWREPLAAVLGTDAEQVERWAQYEEPMPATVPQCVSALLTIARRSRSDAARERARRAYGTAARRQ